MSIATPNNRPALYANVERHLRVEVSWDNENEGREKERFEGFVSRIIQHEYDHVDGILFTDRIQKKTDLVTGKYYEYYIRGKSFLHRMCPGTLKKEKSI